MRIIRKKKRISRKKDKEKYQKKEQKQKENKKKETKNDHKEKKQNKWLLFEKELQQHAIKSHCRSAIARSIARTIVAEMGLKRKLGLKPLRS